MVKTKRNGKKLKENFEDWLKSKIYQCDKRKVSLRLILLLWSFYSYREQGDGKTPQEGEKVLSPGWAAGGGSCVCSQHLWSPIKHSLSCCRSSEGEPFQGQTPCLGCLEDGGGSPWAFAQVSSEFKCQLKQEPVLCPVPDHSPARWHLLKLFHLHPSFKGCSEGVCRQVSLPFFFSVCRFTLV